jgi:hypothetical protein
MIEHQERRADTEFNVRSKILAAIDATDDKNQRNLLLLMFGVLETYESGIRRIEVKIDAVLRDEQTIKRMALNGHEVNHHAHHDWVAERIASECHKNCEWVSEQRDLATEMEPVCAWAKEEMAKAEEAAKTKKGLVIKFLEAIVGHLGTAIAVFAIAYITLR